MNNRKAGTTVTNDLSTLADDARALIAATSDVAVDKVAEARKRLNDALESGKELYEQARVKTLKGAQVVDEAVQEHPYQAIGIGIGVGALLGFIWANRK